MTGLCANTSSLAFLRASGVCTLHFPQRTESQRTEKCKEQTIFKFLVAIKKPKLLVQTLNICANTNKTKV